MMSYPVGLWGRLFTISVYKFHDPRLNRSGEIPPEIVEAVLLSDVISGVVVE